MNSLPHRFAAFAIALLGLAHSLPGRLWSQSATVSTVAELRSAIADNGITTININPGTYLLTNSGSGEFSVNRNLTVQNTGGGRVVLDANNASRVFYINSSTVTLSGLTIRRGNGNGGSEGGAIYVNSSTLQLVQSVVDGNATSGSKEGGAIFLNGGALNFINSTISGNSATGSQGGGIYANGGSVLISNSTVASNTASSSSGGGIYRSGATLTLQNSIVADNSGGEINGSGTITGNGTNLVEGGCSGCPSGTITSDPQLGPLQNNGGNSFTHALPASSPATDAASAGFAEATDQRGTVRPQGPAPDIGAFEVVVGNPTPSVTPDGGQGLQRLPSNGTTYTVVFTVSNTQAVSDSFGLKAYRGAAAAIAIVSVDGVGGDTTTITLAASESRVVNVVYSIGDVAAGTVDTLFLRATAPGGIDTGHADHVVVRPSLTIQTTVTPSGVSAPGTDLAYGITVTNMGSADAVAAVHVDSLPGDVWFAVGSVVNTLPSGVGASVTYSDDAGVTWTYVPVSAACGAPAGFDGCVNRIRWNLQNPLSSGAPNNVVQLDFSARIR